MTLEAIYDAQTCLIWERPLSREKNYLVRRPEEEDLLAARWKMVLPACVLCSSEKEGHTRSLHMPVSNSWP